VPGSSEVFVHETFIIWPHGKHLQESGGNVIAFHYVVQKNLFYQKKKKNHMQECVQEGKKRKWLSVWH
jgi:hypothetical protein